MGKIIDKMINVLGLNEYSEYEVDEIQSGDTETSMSSKNRSNVKPINYNHGNTSNNFAKKNSKIVNIHTNVQMEVVVTNPESFDEAKEICNHIKEKKPVVINLEKIDFELAQRITDFVCGACYVLNGNIQKVTNTIFIIAPENVDLAGDVNIKEELETNGIIFPWRKDENK